jgi:hypothetical protein
MLHSLEAYVYGEIVVTVSAIELLNSSSLVPSQAISLQVG